jgi:hypothetical protein
MDVRRDRFGQDPRDPIEAFHGLLDEGVVA